MLHDSRHHDRARRAGRDLHPRATPARLDEELGRPRRISIAALASPRASRLGAAGTPRSTPPRPHFRTHADMRRMRQPRGEHRVLAVHLSPQPDQLIREPTIGEIHRIESSTNASIASWQPRPGRVTGYDTPTDTTTSPRRLDPGAQRNGELGTLRRGKRREGVITLHEHTFACQSDAQESRQ